jgi:hypothetical protein
MTLKFVAELPLEAQRRSRMYSPTFTPEVQNALRDRPGEWALISEKTTSRQNVHNWKLKHPEFEFAMRSSNEVMPGNPETRPGYRVYVYARFVGDKS